MNEFDELAVSIVVDEGVRMRLRSADLIEAIRRMTERGMSHGTIAHRCGISTGALTNLRRRHDIPHQRGVKVHSHRYWGLPS